MKNIFCFLSPHFFQPLQRYNKKMKYTIVSRKKNEEISSRHFFITTPVRQIFSVKKKKSKTNNIM